jgi:hypothetical protein
MQFVATLFSIGIAIAALAATGCDSGHATANGSSPTTPTTARVENSPVPEAPKEPAQLLEKTFDDIKFDIEPDAPFFREMLTPEIEALAGKRIRIRGYILPTPQKRLKQFVLVRDNLECCFGPGAALYDCIIVEMEPGKLAKFSTYPVAVTGEFAIKELEVGGKHLAIYRMVAEEVE